MTRIALGLAALIAWCSAALAVDVTVIGPITPGNCAQFNSTTVIKDAGFNCNGAPGSAITVLTGDGTATGPGSVPFTLATVNANVGSFGSATQCVTVTNNAKGLTTAISAVTCTPAFSSITGTLSAAQAATIAPTFPLVHPSSGNLVCAQGHFLAWMDQNFCSSADNWILNSTDPSALMSLTMGGTITTGDIVTLTFTFAGPCVAGCAVNTGALNSGSDTTTTIASKLVTAIQANANIYNNVAGAQGLVLFISSSSNVVNFDYDSRTPMKLVATVSGSATETVTFPASSTCGTQCFTGWDVNPTDIRGRLPGGGVAPPTNLGAGISSQLYGLIVQSSDSATPNAYSVQYGTLANFVQNSTHGNVQSRWFLGVPSPSGAPGSIGIWVGQHLGPVQDALPTLTGTCGAGATVQAGSTDNAGQINLGTGTATPCNLIFAHTYVNPPFCTITRQSGVTGLVYVIIAGSIQTAGGAASDKINYICMGQ